MKRTLTSISYGVEVRKAQRIFHCIGPQAHAGTGNTRKEAMVAYARRKVMTENEFLDSGCRMCG